MLRHKRMRDRPWWKKLTKPLMDRHLWVPCRDTVAAGIAIGLFFSMILVLPFQMLFAAVLAMRFKVNVPFAMAACWLSNFFTNPLFLVAQLTIGNWMRESLGVKVPGFEGMQDSLFGVEFNAASLILGMMVSAVLLALAAFPIVHLFSAIMPHHLPVRKVIPLRMRKGGNLTLL